MANKTRRTRKRGGGFWTRNHHEGPDKPTQQNINNREYQVTLQQAQQRQKNRAKSKRTNIFGKEIIMGKQVTSNQLKRRGSIYSR